VVSSTPKGKIQEFALGEQSGSDKTWGRVAASVVLVRLPTMLDDCEETPMAPIQGL